jgi:hypothetical protein
VPSSPSVLGIVLAGGEGKRLMPLTADLAKPGVPFGGAYRLGLRPLEPRQRGIPAHLRAHPVQEPLARPPHHDHLADVDAARQLHHPGPGAAAPRPALVHGICRRDLPEPQPGLRREPEVRRGVRRRPRLPHGPAADARPAHRVGCGRDGRRHPGAPQRAIEFGVIEQAPTGTAIKAFREAGRPAGCRGRPTRRSPR